MEQQNSFERPVISITCKADADTNFLSRHYAEAIEAVGGSSIISLILKTVKFWTCICPSLMVFYYLEVEILML